MKSNDFGGAFETVTSSVSEYRKTFPTAGESKESMEFGKEGFSPTVASWFVISMDSTECWQSIFFADFLSILWNASVFFPPQLNFHSEFSYHFNSIKIAELNCDSRSIIPLIPVSFQLKSAFVSIWQAWHAARGTFHLARIQFRTRRGKGIRGDGEEWDGWL